MDVYRTEEEQIEVIRRWWNENGKSLLLGVVVVLVGWFGWHTWQEKQRTTAEAASELYNDLLDAVQIAGTAEAEKQESQKATAVHLAQKLKAEYAGTTYAQFAALLMAKQAVEEKALDKAVTELQWVMDSKPVEQLALLTKLRMARVLFAQDKPEESLALIENVEAGTLQASYEEAKGDIYLSLNRTEDARNAYKKAQTLSISDQSRGQFSVLDMKANDLKESQTATPVEVGQSGE